MAKHIANAIRIHLDVGGTHYAVNLGTACSFSIAARETDTTNKTSEFESSCLTKKSCSGSGTAIYDGGDTAQEGILTALLALTTANIEIKTMNNKKLDGVANFLTWDIDATDGNVVLFSYTFKLTGDFSFVAV